MEVNQSGMPVMTVLATYERVCRRSNGWGVAWSDGKTGKVIGVGGMIWRRHVCEEEIRESVDMRISKTVEHTSQIEVMACL